VRRRWSRAAVRHLEDIHRFIAQHDPAAAARTVQRVIRATERLERFPRSAPESVLIGARELKVRGLPYVVVYEVDADAVAIHGVFHTSRDPKVRQRRGE